MGLNALLDVAKTALFTAQQALTVTGHNIGNVNTPGFSRQQVILTEERPVDGSPGQAGTGVKIAEIRRAVDVFLNRELAQSHEDLGQFTVAHDELSRLERLFGDAQGQGLSGKLNEFFSALQDATTTPSQIAPRSVVLSRASTLSSAFHRLNSDLVETRRAVDAQIGVTISEINSLTGKIAEFNGQIKSAEVSGQNANDLRDQRDLAINELATRVDVLTLDRQDGTVSVFTARGLVLVDQETTRKLVGVESPDNQALLDIGYDIGGPQPSVINDLISTGKLRGLLDVRDRTIPSVQRGIDALAGSLLTEVNQIHRVGYGLDGSTGEDLFSGLSVTAKAPTPNVGTASIANGTVTAPSLLTFHDYEIRFTGPSGYAIVDATMGAGIRGNYTGTVLTPPSVDAPVSIETGVNDTLVVSVDGTTSGTITLSGAGSPGLSYTSGAALAEEVQNEINADSTLAAAGRQITVLFDETTHRLVLRSNSVGGSSAVDVTGGTARGTLGLSGGVSTAASGTYTGPQTFHLDGIAVTVSGAPAANDVLNVNSRDNTARDLAVALSDPSKVALSSTRAGVPGNNQNGLDLVALQSKAVTGLDNATLFDSYRKTATDLGVASQVAGQRLETEEIRHEQLQNFRAQVSGVSLDEELVNLLKFQRAFEAASRMIVAADEMMATLISLKR
ncbi:MAG: flagellar hook-associated protein FlgK [Nitrospira sp.]|nr:flagellar hook-associated protein FlgK [Nitrospira sp.]MDH4370132.1 flagellar hook-associated protein FlgK [Nitrospira sp.]MDH5498628.1 flagellar hook-associated protein FlgK [Nitrospira sp.]